MSTEAGEFQSGGENVRTIGKLFVDQEAATRSTNCEVPFVVDRANYGSSISAPNEGDSHFYWLWVRCEQLSKLAACDGKLVELVGRYDRREYPGESPGGDRIIDITSVREAVAGPSSASDQRVPRDASDK